MGIYTMTTDAELSKLLFMAREQIDMWADVVAARTGQRPEYIDSVRDCIDAYREERGWSQHGFGGES